MCNEGNGLLSRGKIWQMFEHVLGRTSLDSKLQNWTDEKSVSLSPSHVSPWVVLNEEKWERDGATDL